MEKVPQEWQARLQTQLATFEEFILPPGTHPCQLQHPVLSPGSFPRLVGEDLRTPSTPADVSPVKFLAYMIHGQIVKT